MLLGPTAGCAQRSCFFSWSPVVAQRDHPRRARLSRLNWEVGRRVRWDEDVARGSPHATAIPLTDQEVAARQTELQALTRGSLVGRAAAYLLHCWACQTFWTAVIIFAVTRGAQDVAGMFFSAAAYSGAAVLLASTAVTPAATPVGDTTRSAGRAGCRSCGDGR